MLVKCNLLTYIYHMLKSRKPPFDAKRNPLQRNDVREDSVSHDVASHQPPPFILKQTNKHTSYQSYFLANFR